MGSANRVNSLNQNAKPFIVPVFIPHQGCPHRCVFCDQRSVTGRAALSPSVEDVKKGIESFLGYRREYHHPVEIAFYGGTFCGLAHDYQEALLGTAARFVHRGVVDGIRLSTRPDTINRQELDLLKEQSVTTVELGAQSMNDRVLSASNRGHTASDTVKAVRLLKDYGFKVGLQIMPGLPCDTEETMLDTGKKIALLRPDMVRIYPTLVLKNTRLARLFEQGAYIPITLEQAVMITKKLLYLFDGCGVCVIRMGLQSTDSLSGPEGVISGPFHPSFGHLVRSAVFLDKAVGLIKNMKATRRRITFRVFPSDIPRLRGLKNSNMENLMNRFGLTDIRVTPDTAIPKDGLACE
ncbi:MAG: radical SAM protein [Deltaproteobacteria bacterium]|jgi:histone acetyltransferase (RNA polymerase elongator complex component)|nr:radical SAM protein [Deltaproteobacteria bacterium]